MDVDPFSSVDVHTATSLLTVNNKISPVFLCVVDCIFKFSLMLQEYVT